MLKRHASCGSDDGGEKKKIVADVSRIPRGCERVRMANKSTSQAYRKRPGTSGIRGQLYETKLLSLIYFRALHDEGIEEFHLATNVGEIGMFDDICLRAKLRDFDKPVAVFVQAKHRENDKLLTLANKNDLTSYFSSYLKIKQRFQPSNEDVLFKGAFNETDCVFVMYTTAKDDGNTKLCEGSLVTYLNNIIGTGNPGLQSSYTDADIDLLHENVLTEQLITLAQKIAKYMFDDESPSMNDEDVLQYHVILSQNIFDISDIQSEGHRIASLRNDFCNLFSHQFLRIFKDALYSEILERRKVDTNKTQSLLTLFLKQCENPKYLSELIGNAIMFKNGRLEFRDKMIPTNLKHNLDEINRMSWKVHQAVELAVRESIPSPVFNVPAVFGNKDLAIRGNDVKIEKRLDYMCSKLIDLIEKTKPSNIVTIDESMDVGLLRLNGGFASAIGNIFVFDDTFKLFKFCENCESLEKNAKRFFIKLQSQIQNMHDYKFDMKIKSFPRLSLNRSEYDDHVLKDFFSKLVFYTSQGDENHVENILKDEIESNQAEAHNTEIRSEAIFLKYHDEVQKWWMIPKEGSYLTKESGLYKNAVLSASQSLMGIISMILKIKYKDYSFKEAAVSSLHEDPRNAIITDNKALTVAKLLQYMKYQDIVVLDMEYVLELPTRDYNIFHNELMNANEAKTFIIVVDKIQNTTSITSKRLEKIALTLKDKKCIIVTVQSSVEFVKTFFSLTANVMKYDWNNLTDLNEELQKNILENTKILFQGKEVKLGDVLDNVSKANVGGEVLYEILNRDRPVLGKPIVDPNFSLEACVVTVLAPVDAKLKDDMSFSRMEDEFQDRRGFTRLVHKDQLINFMELDFLRELTGDVTVIVANPGMGKSTLLSQVSTVLKQHHQSVWIQRINLLEYAREFSEWQEDKTLIDTLESLKFMCKVALERNRLDKIKISLEATYYGIMLKDCTGDEWSVFELKMFLHYYNSGKVVFLFDGFDEICPHYAYEVLALIKALEGHPLKHKIWITSRSYDKIITILELQFENLYKIAPWSHADSFRQLNRIWDRKKMLENLNVDQLEVVYKFIEFMAKTYKKEVEKKRNVLQIQSKKEIPFSTIYFWFIKYLQMNLTSAPVHVEYLLDKLCYECKDRLEITAEFDASPLLQNLMSDYLYNKIRESDESPNKWYIDTNIFKVYESVLETKLKRVRFEEKNQIDMYKPDNILAYKKEYADFVASHKKMAAFAVFQKHRDQLFDTRDFNEFKRFFDLLKEGIEKSGIICNVVNDTPVFVHATFAEYFAVEFICDLLQGCKENRKTIWNFILNVMFFNCNLDVLATLDAKIEIDKDLATHIREEDEGVIFELLLGQSKDAEIKSSLCEAIRNDLRSLGKLLLLAIENNLNKNNLMDFIKIVTETKMLMIAIKMEYEEIILTIVKKVRMIDKTKLSVLLQLDYENIDELSTDDIIHELHKRVWTRMDIVPEWTNLAGLSGQIYFI